MQTSTISEIADAYGLSLRTLRFYEDRGLLNPMRVGTRRLYSAKDRIRLELILKGKKLGFTLLEIERLLAGCAPGETVTDVARDLPLEKAEVGRRVRELEQRRDELDGVIQELRAVLKARA